MLFSFLADLTMLDVGEDQGLAKLFKLIEGDENDGGDQEPNFDAFHEKVDEFREKGKRFYDQSVFNSLQSRNIGVLYGSQYIFI